MPEIEDLAAVRRHDGWGYTALGLAFLAAPCVVAMCARPSAGTWSEARLGLGAFLAVGGLLLLVGVRKLRSARRWSARLERVRATGVRTGAVVTGLAQLSTGGEGNDPLVRIDLRVTVAGREPYRVAVTGAVPVTLIPAVQPGAVLPVVFDPADPDAVVVEWPGRRIDPDAGRQYPPA